MSNHIYLHNFFLKILFYAFKSAEALAGRVGGGGVQWGKGKGRGGSRLPESPKSD